MHYDELLRSDSEARGMETYRRFDRRKAIEMLLHIAKECPDKYRALKIVYFADREHLSRYGRLICDDRYVAMCHGPVPSGALALVQEVTGESIYPPGKDALRAIQLHGNEIVGKREANGDVLSLSEIECLDLAIGRYRNHTFEELQKESHDGAYRAANINDEIPLKALIEDVPDGKLLWQSLVAD